MKEINETSEILRSESNFRKETEYRHKILSKHVKALILVGKENAKTIDDIYDELVALGSLNPKRLWDFDSVDDVRKSLVYIQPYPRHEYVQELGIYGVFFAQRGK